jgi:tetratricopeptide (TPR) repeat protein
MNSESNILKKLIEKIHREKFAEVISQIDPLIENFADSASLRNIAGYAHSRCGNAEKAKTFYEAAIKIDPRYAQAYNNLGLLLLDQNALDEALDNFQSAIKLSPNLEEAHNNAGVTLIKKNCHASAKNFFESAIAINKNFFEAYNGLGIVYKHNKDYETAITQFRIAFNLQPNYHEAARNLALAFEKSGDFSNSEKYYHQSLKTAPHPEKIYYSLGALCEQFGFFDQAITYYRQAIAKNETMGSAYRSIVLIRPLEQGDPIIDKMEKLKSNEFTSTEDKIHLGFALSCVYENLENQEKSFKCLQEANDEKRRTIEYDISNDIELFSNVKKTFSSLTELSTNSTTTSHRSKKMPIFIVGMPRSGTTLVEQIISSHSEVFGAGELDCLNNAIENYKPFTKNRPNLNFQDIASDYFKEIKKLNFSENNFTDKMPLNFRWAGIIAESFPTAKIIHVSRDARAVCWSNYKQIFNSSMSFNYNLKEVAQYYSLYSETMQFWNRHYNDRILNLNYEELVNNQEDKTRLLIDFIGLRWEENCINFHENKRAIQTASATQARKKIYKNSSLEWQKFRPFLSEMLDNLAEH